MKELAEIVNAKTFAMIEDGSIERMIAEQLTNTIAGGVKEALRGYSTFGKVINEKIETAIQCSARNIELPDYNLFVAEVIQNEYSKVLQVEAVSHLKDLVSKKMKPVEKEAKISQLLAHIKESWKEAAIEYRCEYIEIETDTNDDGTAIYCTIKHPEYDWQNIKVTFYNWSHNKEDTWHIGYIREDDRHINGKFSNRAESATSSVGTKLLQYYAMGTEFEMDQELGDIYVAGH